VNEPSSQTAGRPWWPHVVTFLAWALGVLLPVVTLVIELNSRMCAKEFFDPLPTWVHVFLVACVPVANAVGLIATIQSSPRWLNVGTHLNSAALAISAVYALIFLPLLPLAVIAVLFLGMGLLPLAPLFSFITALVVRHRLKRALPVPVRGSRGSGRPSPWWRSSPRRDGWRGPGWRCTPR